MPSCGQSRGQCWSVLKNMLTSRYYRIMDQSLSQQAELGAITTHAQLIHLACSDCYLWACCTGGCQENTDTCARVHVVLGVCSPCSSSTDTTVHNRGSDSTKLSCTCQLKTGRVTPLLSYVSWAAFLQLLFLPQHSWTFSSFSASGSFIPFGYGLSFILPLLCSHLLRMIIWT